MSFEEAVELVGRTIDGTGVAIVALGTFAALVRYGWSVISKADPDQRYTRLRRNVGKAILLGLEFLVAGDIIRTVAVSPTFTSVGVLALIVLVRTFLSATLEVELEGHWPWQKSKHLSAAAGETAR